MPAPEGWVPLLQPQIPVCCEQVQGSQQCPADAFGPHGGLFLKGVMVTVISVNHGASSSLFFFCVQDGLDAVSFGAVGFVVWLVLHEALKELVGGFGGEEEHGKQLLSGE